MPYKVTKVDGFSVKSPNKTHAKNTTFQKAQAQASLLRAVEHGWKPTGKKKARTYKKKKRLLDYK